jgi:Icc-related predicted phosphoesterase
MKLTWLTDLHLNFLEESEVADFVHTLTMTPCDCFVVSGDIGEARNLVRYLVSIETSVGKPVYFVLGNHDFYRGGFAKVRQEVEQTCRQHPNLHWLPKSGVIALTDTACLVGVDGWGDGRHGNYWGLRVRLNDWNLIAEFNGMDARTRLAKLQELGDESAAQIRRVLPDALDRFQHVLVVTHVPPFRESCWYEGRISDEDYLPHFTCKSVGDVLMEFMTNHPAKKMTVLCGHTHGAGETAILPNLTTITGGAEYYQPAIQRILEVK